MPKRHRQQVLLLSREQRLAAIDAVRPADAGLSTTTWRHVAALVTHIELRTGADGCYCYAETLWTVMHVSRATFFRVRAEAERLGLVSVVHRYNRQGQQSNEWRVAWGAVAALAAKAGYDPARPLSRTQEHTAQAASQPPRERTGKPLAGGRESQRVSDETGGSQVATGGSQSETPLIGIISSSVLSFRTNTVVEERHAENATTECEGSDGADAPKPAGLRLIRTGRPTPARWTAAQTDRVRTLCAEAVRKMNVRKCDERDRSLVAKAAYLSQVRLPEAWFHNAVNGVAVMKPANPWGYLHDVLAEGVGGVPVLHGLLRDIRVPRELLRPHPLEVER
jgi:hypothetical protein